MAMTARFGLGLAAVLLAAGPAAAQSISIVNGSESPVNVSAFGRETGVMVECGMIGVVLVGQSGSFDGSNSSRCLQHQAVDVSIRRPGSSVTATCYLSGVAWGRTVTITGNAAAIACTVS